MLGLFGAHLMLLARDADRPGEPPHFDQSLYDDVVNNLTGILGADHPDMIALGTQLTYPPEDPRPVSSPPMLWRSWLLLIQASNRWPAILPVDVWRRTMRLVPERPFLVWSSDKEDDEAIKEWEEDVAELVKRSTRRPLRGFLPTRSYSRRREDARRRFSMELLAPRAAIDELAKGRAPLTENPPGTAEHAR
jgi:hypothetical protein